MNKSKGIGTKCETAIVRYVRPNGFGGADETSRAQRLTLAGAADQGDIGVCPGVMIESKGGHAAEQASDAQIAAWLEETERERVARGADVAALVVKRKGKGHGNAGQWHAYLPGWAFVQLADTRLHIEPGDPCPAVRITLAEFVTLLRRAGYGDPISTNERTTA